MAMTVDSGSATYCTATQFLQRYDTRTIAQLLSDTGGSVSNVSSDTKLAAILKEASGKVEAAALVGERYRPTDLAALAATSTNQAEFIAGLVADLAIQQIYRRRPDVTMPRMPQVDEAERLLQALADGIRIFGFTETELAGHMDHEVETPTQVATRNIATYQSRRLFGTRGNRLAKGTAS